MIDVTTTTRAFHKLHDGSGFFNNKALEDLFLLKSSTVKAEITESSDRSYIVVSKEPNHTGSAALEKYENLSEILF